MSLVDIIGELEQITDAVQSMMVPMLELLDTLASTTSLICWLADAAVQNAYAFGT